MSSEVGLKEKKRRTSGRSCRHHWIIDTPNGASSRGLCKRCGVSRRFPNAAEDALWGDRAVMGRWSRNRGVAEPTEIKLPRGAKEEDEY